MTRRIAVLLVLALLAGAIGGTSPGAATHTSGCPKVKAPKPHAKSRKPPKRRLDPHKTWTATVVTSCGSFTIRLAATISPHTTSSFVSLARSGFYNDTIFHRIVPGFVIQGGDPTATGAGGPGYSVVDTPRRTTKYRLGTVAMAKTQTEARGTSGSQFFVVTGDASFLMPDYAVLGRVVSGLPVALRISRYGNVNDPAGTPTRIVVVRRIAISSS
jgi:peptidylprolyl isomerase/peptidyl-prolyl cis-trans isomerase B (cyclophilin B)